MFALVRLALSIVAFGVWLGGCTRQPCPVCASVSRVPRADVEDVERAEPEPSASPCSCARQDNETRAETVPVAQPLPRAETDEEARLLARYEGRVPVRVLEGKATYYADSLAGNRTASGERYDPQRFTAAHRTLPFGTVVRVVRPDLGRYVYVRVTDRGPFAGRGRIIDVSRVAAERLQMIRQGVVDVRVEVLE